MNREELTTLTNRLALTLIKNGGDPNARYLLVMSPAVWEEKFSATTVNSEGRYETDWYVTSDLGIKAEVELDPRCHKDDIFLMRDDK